jgi:hypothetical protein
MWSNRRRGILMAAVMIGLSVSLSACVQAEAPARSVPAYSASTAKASPVAASVAQSFEGIGVGRVTASPSLKSPGMVVAVGTAILLLGAAPLIAACIPAVWRERC